MKKFMEKAWLAIGVGFYILFAGYAVMGNVGLATASWAFSAACLLVSYKMAE